MGSSLPLANKETGNTGATIPNCSVNPVNPLPGIADPVPDADST